MRFDLSVLKINWLYETPLTIIDSIHFPIYTCRLINRGLYPLAVEICSYLKLPPEEGEVKVLRQWALRKVSTHIR